MTKKFPFMPLHPKHMKIRTAGLLSEKSAKFGMTRVRADGTPRAHQGVDLAIDPGYRVYAVDSGIVVYTENIRTGYGKQVCIKLNSGIYVFYAHLSRIDVVTGQKISAGQQIGLSGSSGNAAGMNNIKQGSHLHFEVRTISRPGLGLIGRVDPLPYLTLTSELE
jgi:murein DD-endopeptidase MepM/ murein hydrolase activator NlpD